VPAQRLRYYGQYCPIAQTLDLLGDRWTLLIVRDLLRGTARFTDLAQSLRGIPRNLLADRLRALEAAGLVERRMFREVPPRVEYNLTPKGQTLETVLEAIGRWGYEHLLSDTVPEGFDLDQFLGSLTRGQRVASPSATIALHLRDVPDGLRYLELAGEGCLIRTEPRTPPAATLTTDVKTWFGLVTGQVSFEAAERAGRLQVEGDRALASQLPGLARKPAC
jgi:DNA-binding HxlR family transcriptional regulator